MTSSTALPEPDGQIGDAKQLLLGYLDYYRSVIARKMDGLPDAEMRSSRLPSGWSPLELVKHLVYMERRWLEWGFAGVPVEVPWGDRSSDGRWAVEAGESVADLLARLRAGGERTRQIVEAGSLADMAATGGRFGGDEQPRKLAWILFHVLQEYARHAGHLDIVRELIDGSVGE
jgi:uncharacterized damage-inducible protein DinB